MRVFIAVLCLILPTLAHAVQTCDPGYYKPSPESECKSCPTNGYYCPDDDSDDAIQCPADTTDWNTLLEECGYHPLDTIHSAYYSSWGWAADGSKAAAYQISHCRAASDNRFELQEGRWIMQRQFNPLRGDYWQGCEHLDLFYSANPGYYLSRYNWSNDVLDFYHYIKPCTNAHPEHSHYSGPGTPDDPVAGGKTDYNDCPWACDDGYGLHDGACLPLCTADATKFHVGEYVFNIYKDKLTTPAINIGLGDGSVCYVPLVAGSGKGALNVDYHGVIYHTSD